MPRALGVSRAALAAASAAALACATAPAPPPRAAARVEAPAAAAPACLRYGEPPPYSASPVEARVARLAATRLATGGPRPRIAADLSIAARELARGAAGGVLDPLSPGRVRAALARACASDPAAAAVLVQAPSGAIPEAVAAALPRARATHLGAGAFEAAGGTTVVLLVSERIARLAPFPREVAAGARATLSGTLAPRRGGARVVVAEPSGRVASVDGSGGRQFRAALAFPQPGRYVVEVLADGPGGPEVAALLTVSAGGAPLDPPARARPAEPADDAGAEAAVAGAVNATRRRHGLAPLAPSPELAAVARAHSAAMAAAGEVAHVLPGAGDLAGRLRRAGIAYRRAYENVARAASALAAHDAAEASPAHLANVLAPDATRIGVGVARGRLPSGDPTVYLTEVLVGPPDDGEESRLTPEARVREALWRERARLGLPPLTADVALDALARDAALSLKARDASGPLDDAGERALALRRTLAAVDVFVASGPGEATRSSNLRRERMRRVGVGVATGDSRRFGAARLWIAVIYTD